MPDDIDLVADLNAQDDDGLGWSTLGDAHATDRIVPGAMVLAGNRHGQAVVRIVAVDDDAQVHFRNPPRLARQESAPARPHARLRS